MQLRQAYKYELIPTANQQRDMRRFAGSCGFVYNKAPAIEISNHEAEDKFIRYVEMANLLPAWKAEFPWLKEGSFPNLPPQQKLWADSGSGSLPSV
jgi:putative transposase